MRIGITAGDPAGIGLEVILKALPSCLSSAQWILFGHPADFQTGLERFAPTLPWLPVEELSSGAGCGLWFQAIGSNVERSECSVWGVGTDETGRRALAALSAASDQAVAGDLHAIVTAPLSKRLVGTDFAGQTEFLSDRSDAGSTAMAFFAPTFKLVLATRHLPLRVALSSLSTDGYCELLLLVDRELSRFGYPHSRIAVAAVNPHAGEGGMFGSEDDDVLAPAVEACRRKGLDVSGPFSADSLYYRAHTGEFDVVLAPYHDQGLVAVKLVSPGQATNVTLGLPYVRTSPDHGTAFSIAGRGVARSEGMECALKCAVELVSRTV